MEFSGGSQEGYMFSKEIGHFLERYLHKYLSNGKIKE